MARAQFQVLVLPYSVDQGDILYAILRRSAETGGYWQGIAGGGEDHETPVEAARREAFEEAGIDPGSRYMNLQSFCMIPVVDVAGYLWGPDVLLIPEYAFGVEVPPESQKLVLSDEHTSYEWHPFGSAYELLKWDSNRTALWELDTRLCKRGCAGIM